MKNYNEGVVLRDFYRKSPQKLKVKEVPIEYEDVDIGAAIRQILTNSKNVV